MEARPYQTETVDSAFDLFEGGTDSALAVLPTGTGKTFVAGMACRRVRDHRQRTGRSLFLAHRKTLIRQAYKTLRRMGLTAQVEMGMERVSKGKPPDVVIATVQTLNEGRLLDWDREAFDLIVTDECHHARSKTYRRIYNHFTGHWHLGITATAGRSDGKNLGKVYKALAKRYTLREAIRDEWLVPIHPNVLRSKVDLRGLTTTRGPNGDLNAGDLAERLGPLVEQLCRVVAAEVGDRQTVVFTPDVGCAVAVAQVMNALGVPSSWVSGVGGRWGMNRHDQDRLLKEFDACGHQLIACADLLTEGWDCPAVSCVVNMRPTRSRFRYAQMVGRGTRPCPEIGKEDCLLLDFDWLADDASRDLCSPVDLFDDGEEDMDDAVLTEARKRVKAGEYKDLLQAIEESEKAVRCRPKLDIRLSGKKLDYTKYLRDPNGLSKLLGVKLTRYDRSSKDNPATPAQINLLKSRGIPLPEKLSKWGASKMIDEIRRRDDANMASVKQVAELVTLGAPGEMASALSREDASRVIRQMKNVPNQKEMFTQ